MMFRHISRLLSYRIRHPIVVVVITTVIVSVVTLAIQLPMEDIIEGGKRDATRRQLSYFRIRLYAFTHKRIPRPHLQDAVRELLEDPDLSLGFAEQCPFIVNNSDAWGRAFVYEREQDGRQVKVRSLGEDGRDDQGGGDDIEVTVYLPVDAMQREHGEPTE